MKKIFVVIMAMAAVTACATDDVIRQNSDNAIEFDNASVDNSVRTAIDNSYADVKGNLTSFQVWGSINNRNNGVANIFNGVEVTKGGVGVGANWTYGVEYTQYWIPGNDYKFVGIVDGNVEGYNSVELGANYMPTVINVDMTAQKDVLCATPDVVAYDGGEMNAVSLNFKHLLAKAKFTAKNTMSVESGYTYTVDAIRITNADKFGAYTIAEGTWAAQDTYVAAFGAATTSNEANAEPTHLAFQESAESNYELLLLPTNGVQQTLNIEVDYTLYRSGVAIEQFSDSEKTLNAYLAVEKGKAYNFVLEFGKPGQEITFTATVEEWDQANAPIYNGGKTVMVSDAEELTAAIADANVGAVVLNNDITLGSAITRADEAAATIANKDFVIDGNGHTLSFSSNRAIDILVDTAVVKNVTIKNLTIKHTGSYYERGINFNNTNGTLLIDNVKFEGTAPTYAINLPGSSDGAKVTIKNSHIVGNIALNVWGENVEIDVVDSYLSNCDKTEAEDYAAIKLNNDGSTIAEGTVVNIKGGKVIALNEKGEPSNAAYNATDTGVINISETTEVVGTSYVQVAIVDYGTTNFYGMTSIQAAIDRVVKDNKGTVRVTKTHELTEQLTVPAGATVEIDLNGKSVSIVDNIETNFELLKNQGNLTVVGPGKLSVKANIDSGTNRYSAVIANTVGGNLTVKGGVELEHLGGTYMAYGIDNLTNGKGTSAVTTIEDATVKSTYRAVRQFLNGVEATNELYVKAGAVLEGPNKSLFFHDPSKNANSGKLVVEEGAQLKGDVYLFVTAGSTEWPVEVSIASSTLAEGSEVVSGNVPVGYAVVEEDGAWTVIEQTVADSVEVLSESLAAGKDVVLAGSLNNVAVDTKAPYGNYYGVAQNGGVFDGGNNVLDFDMGTKNSNGKYDNYGIMTSGGTIKNVTITGVFRGIMIMNPDQDLYIDNVTIGDDDVCYAINTGEGNGEHSVYVSNSTIKGWSSFGNAIKDLTFTNCTFAQGTYYNDVYGRIVKPYVDTVFEGCEFNSLFYIDLSHLGKDGDGKVLDPNSKIILKNCTVNGVKLTAENWTSLIAPEDTCGNGQISVELKDGSYLTATNVVDYVVFE